MAVGGGGGLIGVFALAAVQHSTFHCDIQHCDLRKPAQQRSSVSLSLSLSPASHLPSSPSYSLPTALHSESSTSPSFYIQTWEIICHLTPPSPFHHQLHPHSCFALSCHKLSLSSLIFDRAPLLRQWEVFFFVQYVTVTVSTLVTLSATSGFIFRYFIETIHLLLESFGNANRI